MPDLMDAYYEPYGKKYRMFDESKDTFPALPKGVIPVFILEEELYTFLWGFDKTKKYVFEWDKVSPTYNCFRYESRT